MHILLYKPILLNWSLKIHEIISVSFTRGDVLTRKTPKKCRSPSTCTLNSPRQWSAQIGHLSTLSTGNSMTSMVGNSAQGREHFQKERTNKVNAHKGFLLRFGTWSKAKEWVMIWERGLHGWRSLPILWLWRNALRTPAASPVRLPLW